MPITITLSDEIYERYQRLAAKTGLDVEDLLMQPILLSPVLSEFDEQATETLPDDSVITLADSKMDYHQSHRMSDLLNKQQSGTLTPFEKNELAILMVIYTAGQHRKLDGVVEAVRRGLRERMPV